MNEAGKVKPNRYFIISLDGGGVRCALQITLLKRIFAKFPSLEQKICLVAGTSAGALVGSVLSALGVEKMIEHMSTEAFAKKIFAESWAHEVRSMKGLYRANYVNRELAKLLSQVFGDDKPLNFYKLNNQRSDILITSFRTDTTQESNCKQCVVVAPIAVKEEKSIELTDMNSSKKPIDNVTQDSVEIKESPPVKKVEEESRWSRIMSMLRWRSTTAAASTTPVVDNITPTDSNAIIQEACNQKKQHQAPQHKCNCLAWHAELYHTFDSCCQTFVNVLLKTTAAPTYFPAHQGCVDGGVIAQNPSLLATTFALKYGQINGLPVNLSDITLLSLGSGSHPMNMNTYGMNADLGLAQWVPNLTSLFNDASLDATEINCRNL